jgi:hypothetical protein
MPKGGMELVYPSEFDLKVGITVICGSIQHVLSLEVVLIVILLHFGSGALLLNYCVVDACQDVFCV